MIAGLSAMMLLALAAAEPPAPPRCAAEPITAAVDRYAAATRRQDSRAIAAFYGADGILIGGDGAPLTGAAPIARMLDRFAEYRVTDERMTTDAVVALAAAAGRAQQWAVTGSFDQHGTAPDHTSYAAHGRYDSVWACAAGGWQIARMATVTDGAGGR